MGFHKDNKLELEPGLSSASSKKSYYSSMVPYQTGILPANSLVSLFCLLTTPDIQTGSRTESLEYCTAHG